MRRTVVDIPILTGDHDISLVVKDHNHGNHGSCLFYDRRPRLFVNTKKGKLQPNFVTVKKKA